MNKFIFITFLVYLLLMGCSSSQREIGLSTTNKVNYRNELTPQSESLWIIEKNEIGAKAGIYDNDKSININHLNINVELYDLLAKVKVDLSYEPAKISSEQILKYPHYQGFILEAMLISVGNHHFKAIIVEKNHANAIYDKAKEKGLNALKVSEYKFSKMVIAMAFKNSEKISLMFSYTQLCTSDGISKSLILPAFEGLEKCNFNLNVIGKLSGGLSEIKGLGEGVNLQKLEFQTNDSKILEKALSIKYLTQKEVSYISANNDEIYWDEVTHEVKLSKNVPNRIKINTTENFVSSSIAYLKFLEMVKQKIDLKELQEFAMSHKLLSPLTDLIFVDAIKNR